MGTRARGQARRDARRAHVDAARKAGRSMPPQCRSERAEVSIVMVSLALVRAGFQKFLETTFREPEEDTTMLPAASCIQLIVDIALQNFGRSLNPILEIGSSNSR